MFFKNFKTKLIFYIILLIFLISLLFLLFFINYSNRLIKQELTELGSALVRDLSYSSELAVASEDETLLTPYLNGVFGQENVILVAVYNQKGAIITLRKKLEINEMIPQDIIEELSKEKKALKRSNYTREGEEFYDFYSPVLISELLTLPEVKTGKLAGFARIGLSLESITIQSKTILLMNLAITALLILLGFGASFVLAERTTKPIKQLTKGAERIGKGNFEYRIKIKTGDEIEELANSFNQMAENLEQSMVALEEEKASLEIKVKARTEALEEEKVSLEEKVKQRTKELQGRVNELERFHRLTVGRELKMIALKKEIEKLKKELGK